MEGGPRATRLHHGGIIAKRRVTRERHIDLLMDRLGHIDRPTAVARRLPEGRTVPPSPGLRRDEAGQNHGCETLGVDEAERFHGDEAWQERTRKALTRHVGRTEPHVTAGAIASSDRLVKDAERLKVLLRAARQAVVVEMESAGAPTAHRKPTAALAGTATPPTL